MDADPGRHNPPGMDGVPAPGAPEEAAAARLAEVEMRLDAIEHAFARVGEGRYGSCESCGDRLGEELIAADPTLRRCPRCSPPGG